MNINPYILEISQYLTKPLVIFDLETTTNIIKVAEIIQFAGIRIEPMGLTTPLQFLCKPKSSISSQASAVHGIYEQDLQDKPPFSSFLDDITQLFKKADVGGYNIARFDLPILDKQLRQEGHRNILNEANIIDSYQLFTKHFPRTLTQAVTYYTDENLDNAHDAMSDVQANIAVLAKQLKKEDHQKIDQIAEQFQLAANQRVGFSNLIMIDDQNQYIINFGKHKGKNVKDLPKSFIQWVLSKDFPDEVKDLLTNYL